MAGVGTTTIRISNHSANPQNFGSTDNNVGIVIKTSNHRFRPENGANYVELMYYGYKVSGNAALQREIVSGLRHYIETGSFEKMPEPDGQKIAQTVKKATTRTLDDIDKYEQGNMTHDAYLQYKAATEDAIRQNKIDRAEAYRSLTEQLGGVLGESVSRAKAWREEQKARVTEPEGNQTLQLDSLALGR